VSHDLNLNHQGVRYQSKTQKTLFGALAMSDLQCSLGEKHHQGTQAVTSQSLLGQTDIDDHNIDDLKPGTLDIMNDMPDDILLEIFSQVEPVDLFHISRATKALRDLITRNNSMFVWQRVNLFLFYPCHRLA
jgi:F-box domain